MTLSQAVRVPFSRAIANLRDDWDHAGVEAAMVELAQQTPDPGECLALMLAWARRGDARTPAGVLQPGLRASIPASPGPPQTATPTPASLTIWCEPCGANTQLRPDGQKACCWSGDAVAEPYRRTGCAGPPPGLRDQVAASLHQTRERSGIGNGATPGGATTSEGTSDVG